MKPLTPEQLKASDVVYVGNIENTTKWGSSKFADEQLFFKHQYWDDELIMRKDKAHWKKVTNDTFMDTEGPEKYKKYCTYSKRRRMIKIQSKY